MAITRASNRLGSLTSRKITLTLTTRRRTQAEREAYIVAMFGPPSQDPLNATQGCFNQAQTRLKRSLDLVSKHQAAFQELGAAIESDPRVVAVNADWSNCMAVEGYDFAEQVEIRPWLGEQLVTASQEGQQTMAGLQATELRLAEIDFDCYEEHLKESIDTAYEDQAQRILETDQSLLEDLQAALRDGDSN